MVAAIAALADFEAVMSEAVMSEAVMSEAVMGGSPVAAGACVPGMSIRSFQ
jgi:hypothetical protein